MTNCYLLDILFNSYFSLNKNSEIFNLKIPNPDFDMLF